MIIGVNGSESLSEEKDIPILLVLISIKCLMKPLIYKKIKGDFSGYVMGIWYTHFLNGVKYLDIVARLVFQGIYWVNFYKNFP